MYQRVIQIENEVEWIQVQRILDSNDIPFMSNQLKNTAFPDLNTNKKYHQIVIPDEYSEQYFNLVEGGYPNKIIELDKDAGGSKLWLYLMIAYGVIMSLLFFKYYQLVNRSSLDKNFVFEWNLSNTQLKMTSQETGVLHSTYSDFNRDFNYEEITIYTKGKKAYISIDEDENGVFEKFQHFGLNGDISDRSSDSNQDGLIDTMLMVLENRDTILFVDENSNGFFEIIE